MAAAELTPPAPTTTPNAESVVETVSPVAVTGADTDKPPVPITPEAPLNVPAAVTCCAEIEPVAVTAVAVIGAEDVTPATEIAEATVREVLVSTPVATLLAVRDDAESVPTTVALAALSNPVTLTVLETRFPATLTVLSGSLPSAMLFAVVPMRREPPIDPVPASKIRSPPLLATSPAAWPKTYVERPRNPGE